jgi:hypothetical protein
VQQNNTFKKSANGVDTNGVDTNGVDTNGVDTNGVDYKRSRLQTE